MTIAEQLRQEGEHSASLKIARQMLTRGIPRDAVKSCTGLSDDELASLFDDGRCASRRLPDSVTTHHRGQRNRASGQIMADGAATAGVRNRAGQTVVAQFAVCEQLRIS